MKNYAGVERVLAGGSPLVRKLVLNPGDLQIFRGRYSLHRVAPVEGPRKRYVGIFSFVEKEGMCGGVEAHTAALRPGAATPLRARGASRRRIAGLREQSGWTGGWSSV